MAGARGSRPASGGPKVTIRDAVVTGSPTETLVAEALREHVVDGGKGRTITLVKPNVLAQYRLVKILGEAASNQAYVMMCMPLLFIKAIDGEMLPFPNSEAQIEALILRLDDDGLAAVMQGVQEHWGATEAGEVANGELRK